MKARHHEILQMIRARRVRLLGACLGMLAEGAATAAIAWLLKPVLDDLFVNKNMDALNFIPLVVLGIFFIKDVGMYYRAYLMKYAGEEIVTRLREDLYSKIQDLPVSFFQKEKTGVLMARITHDVNLVREMVSRAFTGVLRDGFSIVCLIFVIFYRDWKLALVALVIIPAACYPITYFGRKIRRYSTGYQANMADMSAFLHETFAGNKIVKAFSQESYEKKRFRVFSRKLFSLEMKQVVVRSLSSPVMDFLGGIGIAFVIWFGGSRVISGESTVGTFFSFMAAVLMLYQPVKRLSEFNNTIQQGLAAADRVYDILDVPSNIMSAERAVDLPSGPHRVTFDGVDFQYEHDQKVLEDINLSVEPGEVLALVGPSGGGKTSLVNLIPRFFDVSAGKITIDDIDLRDLTVASLRRQIALVTQEPILFNETVSRNIAYGYPDAATDEIEGVAKLAFAHEFIETFPKKYATPIGELGGRLSGGEKQRICIARALLKDAPILILDEATAALDSDSETIVQKALHNLIKGRTTFVIAHRLSTIRHADRIVVIKAGRIVEEGRHQQLLAKGGEYHRFHQLQFQEERV